MQRFGAEFGRLVKAKREAEGLSQDALSIAAFGPNGRKAQISDIETGKVANPRAQTVELIAKALGIEAEVAALRAGPAPVTNLPPPPPHFFEVGDAEARLRALILGGNAAVALSAQGLGGVGKTTLALHFAGREEVKARFPVRWFVDAETEAGLERGLALLGRALGLAPPEGPEPAAAAAAWAWLAAPDRPALLLLDNVEAPPPGLPHGPGAAHVLVTTRRKALPGLVEIALEEWPAEDAARFLTARSGDADAAAALALAEELGGLALACEQAGAFCAEAGMGLSAYLREFRKNPGAALAAKAGAEGYPRSVAQTFALAIEKAAAEAPGAGPMLSVLGWLAPAPLPLAVFEGEGAPGPLRAPFAAASARRALVRWALAKPVKLRHPVSGAETDCLALHRLVRAAARAAYPAGEPEAAQALGAAFPQDVDSDPATWPRAAALAPHADPGWAEAAWAKLDNSAADAARRALDRASIFLQAAGAYARARPGFEAALAFARARSGFEAALALAEAAHGPEAKATATQLSNLATVLRDLGGGENLEAARAALERALRIDEAALGPAHPSVAIRLSNLANVLGDLGGGENLEAARAALERALRIDEAALGPAHPSVAIRLSNLANVLGDLGGWETLEAARAALERALRIGEAALGPTHPTVAIRLSNLALVLRDLGGRENLEAARAALERALGIDEAALGPAHPNVAIRRNNLAHVLLGLGDRAGAAREARLAVGIATAALGAEHPQAQAFAAFLAALEGAGGG